MKYTKLHFYLCLTAGVLLIMSKSAAAQDVYTIDPQESLIEFSFKSTLHGVHGTVSDFDGEFIADETKLKNGEVHVRVASLDTDHPKRNANMYEMFDVEQFPEIQFQISEIFYPELKDQPLVMHGALTIKDVTVPLDIPVEVEQSGDVLVLKGDAELSLKDFHLEPPSVILLIRVFDTIDVHFETKLANLRG